MRPSRPSWIFPAMAGDHEAEAQDREYELSRRRFIALGGAVVAAGTVGRWGNPLEALAATRWPSGRLDARDAIRVDQRQFIPVSQFRAWQQELDRVGPSDQKGLRATATSAHEHYVDELRHLLDRAGVDRLRFESLTMQRWTTAKWSLDIVDGTAAGPVKTASYIPYSGQTPAGGVTAPLALVPAGTTPAPGSLAGKIAVFDVPLTIVPASYFTASAYSGRTFDPKHEVSPSEPYKRPYLNGMPGLLEALDAAGAVGAVGVLDYPAEAAAGSYFPYDGLLRKVPALYVDRAAGAGLKQQASAGMTARLTLPAQVDRVKTRNLIGFIPGRSSELVTLHCHTDGTNALEDNGPAAIVAMSQYLARLPRRALPRTIMILLTSGHFAGGNGSRAFIARHKDDLLKRINAVVTIEHLGTREWNELPSGRMGFTGRFEPGAIFVPGSQALVDASYAALKRGGASPSFVLKPLNPEANGTNESAWPGEGQYMFSFGRLADANYITGPNYLLNWGIKTSDKTDLRRVRAESIAFTEMILRLGRTPRSKLVLPQS